MTLSNSLNELTQSRRAKQLMQTAPLVVAFWMMQGNANALDQTVLNTNDSGVGSLRAAIAAANADATDDIVYVPTGFYQLATEIPITKAQGKLTIKGVVNATGPTYGGAAPLNAVSISPYGGFFPARAFNVAAAKAEFDDLKITGFVAGNNGGVAGAGPNDRVGAAVLNLGGNLTFKNAFFYGNDAFGAAGSTGQDGGSAQGGVIYTSGGSLTLINCDLTNNVASGGAGNSNLSQGGVLAAAQAPVQGREVLPGGIGPRITNGGNAQGGGIFATGGATVSVSNTLFRHDNAFGGSGGRSSSSSGNAGGNGGNGQGGGIFASGAATTVAILDGAFTFDQSNGGSDDHGGRFTSSISGASGANGGNGGKGQGGGIYVSGIQALTINMSASTPVNVQGNSSRGGYGGDGGNTKFNGGQSIAGTSGVSQGAGIYAASVANLKIQNATIQQNSAFAASGATGIGGSTAGSQAAGAGIFIDSAAPLTLSNLLISSNGAYGNTGGRAGKGGLAANGSTVLGGGIFINGSSAFTINNSTVNSNEADAGNGGVGFTNSAAAAGQGGSALGAGIYISAASGVISNSTLNNNLSMGQRGGNSSGFYGGAGGQGGTGAGGALAVVGASTVKLSNSTLERNEVDAGNGGNGGTGSLGAGGNAGNATGGGVYVDAGVVAINNSTLTDNGAYGSGAGTGVPAGQNSLVVSGGNLFVKTGAAVTSASSIFYNGSATSGRDVAGAISAEAVLVGNVDSAATITATGTAANLLNVTPLLAPLANNGGPTQTRALLSGSPGLDAGVNPDRLLFDQRGNARRLSNTNYDIGAFELQVANSVAPTAFLRIAPPVGDASSPNLYTFSVTYSDDLAIDPLTLDDNDILVTGPNGFSQPAKFVSALPSRPGTTVIVTYSIVPPGGAWTSDANGTYTIAIQPNQVTDSNDNPVRAGSIGTFNVNVSGLVIISPPTMAPNPAQTGQPVVFTIAVTGGTVSWNFGDGSPELTGQTVSHAYTTPGTYNVTVTVTATNGKQVVFPLQVTIIGRLFRLRRASFLLANAKGGDKATLIGILHVPGNSKLAGQAVTLIIGGNTFNFTLDAKGSAKFAQGSFKVTTKKTIADQEAPFTAVISKAALAAAVLANSPLDATGLPTKIVVQVQFLGAFYQADATVKFKSTARGKTANFGPF